MEPIALAGIAFLLIAAIAIIAAMTPPDRHQRSGRDLIQPKRREGEEDNTPR